MNIQEAWRLLRQNGWPCRIMKGAGGVEIDEISGNLCEATPMYGSCSIHKVDGGCWVVHVLVGQGAVIVKVSSSLDEVVHSIIALGRLNAHFPDEPTALQTTICRLQLAGLYTEAESDGSLTCVGTERAAVDREFEFMLDYGPIERLSSRERWTVVFKPETRQWEIRSVGAEEVHIATSIEGMRTTLLQLAKRESR